ncbi:MAG: hypothetical protein K0S56_2609 [Microvirga sp.]|jgi:hypothetical protein|nr:hypothetical protein [Microvirga sp.]
MTQQSIRDRIMSRTAPAPATAGNNATAAPASWRPGRQAILLSFIGVAALVTAVLGATQIPALRGSFHGQQGMPATSGRDLPLAETPFLAHAREAGLKTCGTIFPVLGELLSSGTQYSLQSRWNTSEPDGHAVQSLLGLSIDGPDYSGPAAGIVYAAPNGANCEGAMVRVVPYQKSCDAVAQALLPNGAPSISLGAVQVYDLTNGGRIMLLPSAQSCVAISLAQAAGT